MIFFLNSTNRVYNDKELNALSKLLFTDGVFNTLQTTKALWDLAGDFYVEAEGGSMTITAKPGMASVGVDSDSGGSDTTQQQAIILEEDELSAVVAANSVLANRNDAVVLRVDQSVIDDDILNAAGSNAVSLVVVSGSSATPLDDNAISVALGGDPFVRLANILVPQFTSEITQSMVSDARELSKMTRSVKMASDVFQLFSLSADPADPEIGDMWYNGDDGILKLYDGEKVIALTAQTFDFGYYPPDGIDQDITNFDPVVENPGLIGLTTLSLYYVENLSGGALTTLMAGQRFKMPILTNPYIRVKMGAPTYPADIVIKIYTDNGSGAPSSLVETFSTILADDVPQNDYIDLYLDGTLYTPGNNYVLTVQSIKKGFVNGDPEDFFHGLVYRSDDDSDDITEYLLGTSQGSSATLTTNPLSVSWGSVNTALNFVMSIAEREQLEIGKTDISGSAYRISQAFNPVSRDIIGFKVVKGESEGSPTGDIDISIYRGDENNEPTGDVLASGTITQAEWEAYDAGDDVIIPIAYDELVLGQKYVMTIDTEDHSASDNYVIYFGSVATGKAKRYNSVDGWVTLAGDLFFGIQTSAVRKIPVTKDTGKLDPALIPYLPKRVTYITTDATPSYSVETADAVNITALAENITSMTSGQIGTPYDFQRLIFRIKDNGSSRTISWGSLFANKGATAPTSTTVNKLHTVTFEWDDVTGKWGCIDAKVEA